MFDWESWPFANLLTLSERIGPQAPLGMLHEAGGLAVKMQVSGQRRHQHVSGCTFDLVPPAGFEPALTAPEAVALSPELRGLRTPQGYQSGRTCRAASIRAATTRTLIGSHPVITQRTSAFPARAVAAVPRRRYPRARGAGTGTRARGGRR